MVEIIEYIKSWNVIYLYVFVGDYCFWKFNMFKKLVKVKINCFLENIVNFLLNLLRK